MQAAGITFVDVRSTVAFKIGHIPGAINVPAALVPHKQLPPLGRVVVYDDGQGGDAAKTAASALNLKPGTTAEVLDGGFPAWEMSQAATTKEGGMKPEMLPMITYDRLKKVQGDDVVLVDLRKTPAVATGKAAAKEAAAPFTDLSAEFPSARLTTSPFQIPAVAKKTASPATAAPPLLVLIDNGDGSAQEAARALKANGNTRFVILAGGEEILARKGESGLQRSGTTITVQKPSPATTPNR